jgi:hypothetical protein
MDNPNDKTKGKTNAQIAGEASMAAMNNTPAHDDKFDSARLWSIPQDDVDAGAWVNPDGAAWRELSNTLLDIVRGQQK